MPKVNRRPYRVEMISIPFTTGAKVVEAKVFNGVVAIYKSMDETILARHQWCVSSATTGLRMTAVESEEEAAKVAKVLVGSCGIVLQADDGAVIVDTLSNWVKPWLFKCRDTGKFVEPGAQK